jgi:hypothetical protein
VLGDPGLRETQVVDELRHMNVDGLLCEPARDTRGSVGQSVCSTEGAPDAVRL